MQLYEKTEAHGYGRRNKIFQWQHRPMVAETSLNICDFYDTDLKAAHFNTVVVDVMDEYMNLLSETVDNYSGYDFEIVN